MNKHGLVTLLVLAGLAFAFFQLGSVFFYRWFHVIGPAPPDASLWWLAMHGSLTLILCAVAAALYLLRSRYRLAYGLLESGVAVAVMFGSLFNPAFSSPEPIAPEFGLPKSSLGWLQVVVGLYVFVRGLDNIGEGLKLHPRAYACWRSVFPEAPKPGA